MDAGSPFACPLPNLKTIKKDSKYNAFNQKYMCENITFQLDEGKIHEIE